MKKIVHFCIDHPYWVIGFLAIITLFFAAQIPKIKMDSRVEVMLRHDYPPVQVFIENKQSFERYTDVIVGMMHANIYDPGSLAKLYKVAQEFKKIRGIHQGGMMDYGLFLPVMRNTLNG